MHDLIYAWQGWGGRLRLGSGKCRLSIFDLDQGESRHLAHLKPMVVVASDMPDSSMSVRSCASHIATNVAKDFNIRPQRMLFVEYYPQTTYGDNDQYTISERYDMVEFTWVTDKAIKPRWRRLPPAMWDILHPLMRNRPELVED